MSAWLAAGAAGWALALVGWGAFVVAIGAVENLRAQRDDLASRYIRNTDADEPREAREDWVWKISHL